MRTESPRKHAANFIIDDYVSPKIIAGPYATDASLAAAATVRNDPAYQELTRRLQQVGFFDAAPLRFAWRIALFAGLYLGAFAYLLTGPSILTRVLAWLVIGFAHVQGNFVAHDAGHSAITRNKRVGNAIGQLFDSFLGGYSFTYFRRVHDLHHFHCNEVDRDPNTMTTLFAFHERAASDKTGFTRLTARLQHLVIPFVYPLWAFVLRAEGVAYVVRNRRKVPADAIALVGHVALWTVLPIACLGGWTAVVNYLGMTAFASVYIGLILPMNHVGMPSLDADAADAQTFIAHQVATSRNVTSSPVRDFLFTGQNSHIEHHLFPWVPTLNLRRGRPIIRAFCRERGLPYRECSYARALADVHVHLFRMARYRATPGWSFDRGP